VQSMLSSLAVLKCSLARAPRVVPIIPASMSRKHIVLHTVNLWGPSHPSRHSSCH
jgi:hypothetical protein